MSDDKVTPAQQLHQAFERLKGQMDAERVQELDLTHGRSVGGVPRRALTPAQERRAADDIVPPAGGTPD